MAQWLPTSAGTITHLDLEGLSCISYALYKQDTEEISRPQPPGPRTPHGWTR